MPDDIVTVDDGIKLENQVSRLPKDISSYLENVKTAFTNIFLNEILAKIENATVDVNAIILCKN